MQSVTKLLVGGEHFSGMYLLTDFYGSDHRQNCNRSNYQAAANKEKAIHRGAVKLKNNTRVRALPKAKDIMLGSVFLDEPLRWLARATRAARRWASRLSRCSVACILITGCRTSTSGGVGLPHLRTGDTTDTGDGDDGATAYRFLKYRRLGTSTRPLGRRYNTVETAQLW